MRIHILAWLFLLTTRCQAGKMTSIVPSEVFVELMGQRSIEAEKKSKGKFSEKSDEFGEKNDKFSKV